MKYAFIRAHRKEFGTRAKCRMSRVHIRGCYASIKEPLNQRTQEDAPQTELIQQAWADSGKVFGYRKLQDDQRAMSGNVVIGTDRLTVRQQEQTLILRLIECMPNSV